MAETRDHVGRSRLVTVASAVGVCGLAAAGFTISFSSLNDLAVASGIDRQLAFLWPLIVDGFIVVTTAAAFALKQRGPAVTWYPWTALVLFSAISVVGNAIHASQAADIRVPLLVATAVSSVPAIALLVATHLLVVMAGTTDRPTAQTATGSVASEAAAARPQAIEAITRDVRDDGRLVERLRQLPSGETITSSVIAHLEGVSERPGRRRLAALRAQFPDLFNRESEVEG